MTIFKKLNVTPSIETHSQQEEVSSSVGKKTDEQSPNLDKAIEIEKLVAKNENKSWFHLNLRKLFKKLSRCALKPSQLDILYCQNVFFRIPIEYFDCQKRLLQNAWCKTVLEENTTVLNYYTVNLLNFFVKFRGLKI